MNKHVSAIAFLLVMLAGCSQNQGSQDLTQLPLDVEAGKNIAQQNCAICHGMDGRGVADNIPNLAGQLETYLLKAVQTYDHGKRTDSSGNVMKVAEKLNSQQLRNVIGYYASLPSLTKLGGEVTNYSYYERGKALSKPCAGCHGKDGNTTVAGVPRLAGQHPQYIIKAAKAYRDGTRTMPTMHAQLTGLSQADLENIAIYFALNDPKQAVKNIANSHEGKQFTSTCAKCHGAEGSGDDLSTPNLAGQNLKYLNTVIRSYRDNARDHKAMHQALKGLSNSDIDKVARFFAAEKPMQTSFAPPEPVNVLIQKCDICHSQGNANPEMLTPKIDGQNRAYLINAMSTYRDGDRGNSAMHTISSAMYFDATIEALADHYSKKQSR